MGSFLTGFASGAFKGANDQFTDDNKQYDQMMNQRAKAVDTVAENWNKYQDKLQQTTQKQNSYMAQFNIPQDAAYSLATDDSFEKMPKDQQFDYAKSLQPVQGQMTPATPGGSKTLVPPAQTHGTLFTPGRTIAPVTTPNYPAQPARQIYEGGSDTMQKVALKLLGDSNAFVNPDGSSDPVAQKAATDAAQRRDWAGVINAVQTRQHNGPAGADKDPVFKQVQDLVTNKLISAEDAPKYYTAIGGKNPQAQSLFGMLGQKDGKGDPVFQQKVDAQEEVIKHNNPGIDPQAAHDRAVNIVIGSAKAQPDAVLGGGGTMDLSKPPSQQYTRYDTTGMGRQRIQEAQNVTSHAANTLTSLNRNLDLLSGNPGVVGYQGELAHFLESHGANLANAIGAKGISDAISQAVGSGDTATYRAESRTLMASMAKEIIGESKTSEDQRKLLDSMLGNEWQGTPRQIGAYLHVLKERAIQNFANNLTASEEKAKLPYLLKTGQDPSVAPAGRETMPATEFLDYIVEKYHIPRDEARQVIRYTTSFQPAPNETKEAKQ